MVYLKYNNIKLPICNEYSITKSSQDISFSNIECEFTGHSSEELPEKYQEVQIVLDENTEKILFTGYIESYTFNEMRETDIDIYINFSLMSPKKMATLRTIIAVGSYQIKDLIKDIILEPLINDGYELKEIEITNRTITVNYLCKTVEFALNDLSNKYNFWWYIDENKKIHIKDVELLMDTKNIKHIYDEKNCISGLQYIKPTIDSEDYANVINFINVRIYEKSFLYFDDNRIVETYNPILDEQITNVKQYDYIDFNFPVDIKIENIIKSAESNSVYLSNIYGIYMRGKYLDDTTFEAYYGYDTITQNIIRTENLGFEGDTNDNEKEFLLIRDTFFNNLITGIKYNGTKILKEIIEIKSNSALIWNVNKFYNEQAIANKKNKISKTGIVELTVDMNGSWKTIQELENIGASYMNKNSLKLNGQIELKTDEDVFKVGDLLYINKLLFNDMFIVTKIQMNMVKNEFEYLVIGKNANLLSNYIDIFRGEETQENSEKTYKVYISHYNEEEIRESHEVIQ